MYHVRAVVDKKYNIYELVDMATNSRVKIAPERGGIIFSYSVGGQELLYLNEETFYHQDQNVRGGIPILFPISGQLNGGTYEWEGTNYTMGNHGFARNAIWEVIDSHTDNRAALTIRLTSNVQTKKAYPFDFEVVFTYSLEKGKLTIHQEYKNKGNGQCRFLQVSTLTLKQAKSLSPMKPMRLNTMIIMMGKIKNLLVVLI